MSQEKLTKRPNDILFDLADIFDFSLTYDVHIKKCLDKLQSSKIQKPTGFR